MLRNSNKMLLKCGKEIMVMFLNVSTLNFETLKIEGKITLNAIAIKSFNDDTRLMI